MMLLLHIGIALISLGFTALLWFSPSAPRLRAAYALVAATLASGAVLVVVAPAQLTSACRSGLIYLTLVTIALMAARRKTVHS